jgi:hypothetical protein
VLGQAVCGGWVLCGCGWVLSCELGFAVGVVGVYVWFGWCVWPWLCGVVVGIGVFCVAVAVWAVGGLFGII